MNGRRRFIAERWREYDAERRANLLRAMAIGLFYSIHLWHFWSASFDASAPGFLQISGTEIPPGRYHLFVTALALAWTMQCLAIAVCLRQHFFPPFLKYLSTSGDIFFLTTALYAGNGPRSPLIVGYYLILALAAIRMHPPLLRFATLGGVVGYICLVGCAKWPEYFGDPELHRNVPRYEQLIIVASIVMNGIILDQLAQRGKTTEAELADTG